MNFPAGHIVTCRLNIILPKHFVGFSCFQVNVVDCIFATQISWYLKNIMKIIQFENKALWSWFGHIYFHHRLAVPSLLATFILISHFIIRLILEILTKMLDILAIYII